ncbi:MAG TPA: cobalt ECF transporter T component CbiQ [Candidatus Omnitrophota bacterium]|nr:cobalt ECF transporter T component CbiQ [Candidatus Omnitrophota bacterium]
MRHQFLDEHAYRGTALHRASGGLKILFSLAGILWVVGLGPGQAKSLAVAVLFLAGLTKLGKIPPGDFLKRMLLVFPIAAMIGISVLTVPRGDHGVQARLFGLVIAKALISVWILFLLTATTPFPVMLESLARMRCPKIFLMLLGFCYRYLFLMADEAERMTHALASRGYEGRWLGQARFIGHLIGMFFVRSYERGERVFAAMLSRGYEGPEHWRAYE